jgi:O-antigen/teichoic acid export membrane protein
MATSTDLTFSSARTVPDAAQSAPGALRRNVVYGVLDYLVQPALTVLSARFFVRHLGIAQFGLWMLILALVGSMGVFCTGFGDAALKYVASMRGRGDAKGVVNTIRAAQALNLLLGATMAVLFLFAAPWASTHAFHLSGALATSFTAALRIGGMVLVLRSLSFVYISTLKAYELYRLSTPITAGTRIAVITAAAIAVVLGHGLIAILWVTCACELVSLICLTLMARSVVGPLPLTPDFRTKNFRSLASFGTFTWLQALLGTVFSQADRLLVASMLGPAAVGYYGVCVQAAQPVHGLAAAGSNVLFPHVSARMECEDTTAIRSTIRRATRLNLIVVVALVLPLALLSGPILRIWMGSDFSRHAAPALAVVALSFAALAFNIPGHYALMALGRVRYLAGLNFVGMTMSFLIALLLIPRFGIVGAALGRLSYGPITWLLYPKLNKLLSPAIDRENA